MPRGTLVQPHVFGDRILGLLPRSPEHLWGQLNQAGQALAQDSRMLWSCVALILAGTTLVVSVRRVTALLSILALVLTSWAWLRANQTHEGAILVFLAPEYGITTADLLVPAVILPAVLGRLLRE